MNIIFEGGHESGILDLDGKSDEEMEESVSPSPSIVGKTEEEDSDDESETVSAENDHDQPGDEEGEEYQAAKRSASNISEESETSGVEDKNDEINKCMKVSKFEKYAPPWRKLQAPV